MALQRPYRQIIATSNYKELDRYEHFIRWSTEGTIVQATFTDATWNSRYEVLPPQRPAINRARVCQCFNHRGTAKHHIQIPTPRGDDKSQPQHRRQKDHMAHPTIQRHRLEHTFGPRHRLYGTMTIRSPQRWSNELSTWHSRYTTELPSYLRAHLGHLVDWPRLVMYITFIASIR